MIKIDIKKDLHGSNGLMKLEINLEMRRNLSQLKLILVEMKLLHRPLLEDSQY